MRRFLNVRTGTALSCIYIHPYECKCVDWGCSVIDLKVSGENIMTTRTSHLVNEKSEKSDSRIGLYGDARKKKQVIGHAHYSKRGRPKYMYEINQCSFTDTSFEK